MTNDFPDFTARYKCGTCDYEETRVWSEHQAHYINHKED